MVGIPKRFIQWFINLEYCFGQAKAGLIHLKSRLVFQFSQKNIRKSHATKKYRFCINLINNRSWPSTGSGCLSAGEGALTTQTKPTAVLNWFCINLSCLSAGEGVPATQTKPTAVLNWFCIRSYFLARNFSRSRRK